MKRIIVSCLLVWVLSLNVAAQQLKLPTVISSGMVLQQNENVNIWGWAKKSAKVTVKAEWMDKSVTTKADDDGK